MIANRYVIAVSSLLGVAASAGCSGRTGGPALSMVDNERVSPAGVSISEADRTQERGQSEARPTVAGQPVSTNPAAVEEEDARAGREADRTGANPERIADIDIRNLKDGRIWVGGEPTDKGYRQIHERGVTAIVDLRNPTPVQKRSAEQARRLGMDYVNLPIDPKRMPSEKATAFLEFMRKHEGNQVLIHCGSANRASGMYAVYLGVVKGLSTEDAIRRAKATGLKKPELEWDVRHYLDERRAPAQPRHAVQPAEHD